MTTNHFNTLMQYAMNELNQLWRESADCGKVAFSFIFGQFVEVDEEFNFIRIDHKVYSFDQALAAVFYHCNLI